VNRRKIGSKNRVPWGDAVQQGADERRSPEHRGADYFAFLSLLTRSTDGGIHELAETLHKDAPENEEVVSTYAFSLSQRGRIDDALEAMKALKPEQLRKPSVARYQAIFLTAAGRVPRPRSTSPSGNRGSCFPRKKSSSNRQRPPPRARQPRALGSRRLPGCAGLPARNATVRLWLLPLLRSRGRKYSASGFRRRESGA